MMDSSQDSASRDDRSFGDILAEARKSRNYTLSDVRENIKVAEDVLSAIEANDIDSLPDQTYIRGYIKAYAKFLEIPEQDVLDKFNRLIPKGNPSELKPRSELSKRGVNSQSPVIKMVTTLLVAIGLITVIYAGIKYYQEKADVIEHDIESQEPAFTGNSLDSPGNQTTGSAQPDIGVKQVARMTDDGQLLVDEEANVDLLAEESESYKSIAETVIQEESEDVNHALSTETRESSVIEDEVFPEDKPVSAEGDEDSLEIHAVKGSWLQVHDANDVRLFYNMLPEGSRRTLRGKAPFSVFMGNAGTTDIEINGLRVDLSAYIRPNNTARFKVSSDEKKVIFH